MEEGEKYETSSLSSVVVPIDGSKGLIVVIGLLWRRLLCWNDARVGHEERRRGPKVQVGLWACLQLRRATCGRWFG